MSLRSQKRTFPKFQKECLLFPAPFLYGLYWKRASAASVWVTFAFGSIVMLVNTFMPSLFPVWLRSPINCGAFVMLAGLIIVPLVSLLTPKKVENQAEEAFSALKNKEKD